MVCGSLMPGIDQACNCCGCIAVCCCGPDRQQCCDFCNHCFCLGPICCEMCPCGANGCIGYPNHLCGCCGNCNILWYAGSCTSCFVADLLIATDTTGPKDQEWSNVVCNVVILDVIYQICQNLSTTVDPIFGNIGSIVNAIMYIYMAVVFGKAATKIAAKKGWSYEPAECCNKCYDEGCWTVCGTCCTSFDCCCAYFCCYQNHTYQVARVIETDAGMQSNITDGRPEQCKCCNCFVTAKPVELGTTGSA